MTDVPGCDIGVACGTRQNCRASVEDDCPAVHGSNGCREGAACAYRRAWRASGCRSSEQDRFPTEQANKGLRQKTDVGSCEPGYTLMSCTQTRYTTARGGLSILREINDEQCRFNTRVLEMQVRCCATANSAAVQNATPINN